ncbi:MAG: VCBS repeat-containing protein, partial [Candidatus Marinimicrobia bacterium]|nr:VCBS repeat-containing protein [Candidatus Neomarinimicrobiota bacterium]
MNRFFKIIIIVLFSSVLLIGNQIPKYQWKEINLPNNTIYGIAEISSKNNFWIYEKTANFIYHYKDSIIQKIELPKTKKIKNHYHCIKIDSMKFFSTIVDENYHTSFYIYELGAWKKFNIEVDVPVRNIVQVSRDELYVYGDWGAIFHLKNKQLFQLNSPIKNHIMAIGYYDKNNIWFGVRKEGIYHYDRKNFTNIPINNYNKSDISNIVVNSLDEISIYMRSGSEYYKQKNKFINRKNTIDNTDNLLFDFSDYKNGVAYTNNSRGEYYLFYDKKWTTKKLEKNYLIYDCEMSGDGSIMFTSKGKIIIGNVTKNIFFMEHAGQYRLDGGIADYSNGTAFLNYNDDNFIDIFVQNSGNQQYNRLYKNNNGKNFDDISSLSKISFYESSDYFTVGDYDVNGEIDLLLTNSDYQLQLLKREKDLFKKYNIDIKDSSVSSIRNLQLFDFDNDNDLDIFNSYHYSNGKNVGNILLLKNNFFGSFIDIDTSITDLTKGWNNHNLFADFNNDNKTDIFISNSWIKNKLILSNENNEYELIKLDKNNMAMAIGLDFENDGDLDIFYVTNVGSLYLLINDSKGQFTKYLNGEPIIKNIKSFICNGDFNNDGFIDLFLSSSINERNYLLLNDSAKTFIDISQKAGIKENNI